ncbi:antitoxin VbhA family protein [Undibacterium sp. Ji67W]|uniref:antitoxin VbhA family protein n=1 Tax=Undibacterium sp. Ji67W TaxID=3413042 RepID=UPI003BF2BB9D
MTDFRMQERRRAVTQTLASWALEGFEPDAEYLALLEKYVSGELTLAEIGINTDIKFGVHTRVQR